MWCGTIMSPRSTTQLLLPDALMSWDHRATHLSSLGSWWYLCTSEQSWDLCDTCLQACTVARCGALFSNRQVILKMLCSAESMSPSWAWQLQVSGLSCGYHQIHPLENVANCQSRTTCVHTSFQCPLLLRCPSRLLSDDVLQVMHHLHLHSCSLRWQRVVHLLLSCPSCLLSDDVVPKVA